MSTSTAHGAPPRRVTGRRVGAVVVAALLVAALGACEQLVTSNVNTLRAAAGRPTLPVSAELTAAARAKSQAMCTAGAVTPTPNPGAHYGDATHGGVHELVASAAPDVPQSSRNLVATEEIWAGWKDDPQLAAAHWDEMGVGEVQCADGHLYMTAVLRAAATMPATGLYSSPQFTTAQLTEMTGVQYGSAINEQGQNQALLLDLYVPPGPVSQPRPTIVLVHGGSFVSGNPGSLASAARAWAVRGFVAVSIAYRLATPASMEQPGGQLVAAARAIDDGMESVRWLKANAGSYGIDPARIGMVGYSAGGAIAMGVALTDDTTPGGPLAAYAPTIAGAISTGAHLTPGIENGLITFESTDAPIMMFHYETDTVTGVSDEYAFETCAAVRASANTCDFITQPGSGHTTSLTPGGPWWSSEVGPFTWLWLGLL